MWNPFKRKIAHPDGVDAYYTPGVVFDGGANHLAYRNDRPHPLINSYMGFIPQRQLRVTERQVVYQFNALPVMPIIAGIVAGQVNTQMLLDNGQLSSTANNQLVNNSLFGGVQS